VNGDTVTTKAAGTLTRTGYTFAGWNTQRSGAGVDYAALATFEMGIVDVILYAKWTATGGDSSVLDETINLVTLDELKTYLQIDLSSTTQDTKCEELINAVSRLFNDITNRKLKQRLQISEYYNGDGSDKLLLDNPPVANLKLYLDYSTPRDFTTEFNSNYVHCIGKDAEIGRVIIENDIFYNGPQTVKAAYDAGFAVIPYMIKRNCLIVCANYWSKETDKVRKAQSISVQGSSITIFEDDVPKSIIDYLEENYKKGAYA
jgi:uncharacterized repeat protein (TIGR02543 family)